MGSVPSSASWRFDPSVLRVVVFGAGWRLRVPPGVRLPSLVAEVCQVICSEDPPRRLLELGARPDFAVAVGLAVGPVLEVRSSGLTVSVPEPCPHPDPCCALDGAPPQLASCGCVCTPAAVTSLSTVAWVPLAGIAEVVPPSSDIDELPESAEWAWLDRSSQLSG